MSKPTRPKIPAALKRDVLVEAGHRCAIPTCQHPTTEIAHIEPWAKCKTHAFDNLIALCPTCHTRFDNGQIDKKSIKAYKNNLTILNSRYSDLEKRVLRYFHENPKEKEILLPGGFDIMLSELLRDQMLVDTGKDTGVILSDMPSQKYYAITPAGKKFLKAWMGAKKLPS